MSKLLITLGLLTVMTGAYACRTVLINTPNGTTVCYVCNDGKIINCEPLQEKTMIVYIVAKLDRDCVQENLKAFHHKDSAIAYMEEVKQLYSGDLVDFTIEPINLE